MDSSNFFSAKSLLPSALSASAMAWSVNVVCGVGVETACGKL